MTAVVVVLVVIAFVVIAALALTNPVMRRREDDAIRAVRDHLGPGAVTLIEPRTTAMGTDPEEAGGLRGMVCLGLSDAELMAVTWVGSREWRIPRASVVGVDTPAEDPTGLPKATITVSYARPDGTEATAMFRLRDAADWLTALGYDWGEAGPPVRSTDDLDDEASGEAPGGDDASGGAGG